MSRSVSVTQLLMAGASSSSALFKSVAGSDPDVGGGEQAPQEPQEIDGLPMAYIGKLLNPYTGTYLVDEKDSIFYLKNFNKWYIARSNQYAADLNEAYSFYHSEDLINWTGPILMANPTLDRGENLSYVIEVDGLSVVYAYQQEFAARTTDGINFELIRPDSGGSDYIVPEGHGVHNGEIVIYNNTDSYPWKSSDGFSFSWYGDALPRWYTAAAWVDGDDFYAVTQEATFEKINLVDPSSGWTQITSVTIPWLYNKWDSFVKVGNKSMMFGIDGFMMDSEDGINWAQNTSSIPATFDDGASYAPYIAFNQGNTVYLIRGDGGKVVSSLDAGVSFGNEVINANGIVKEPYHRSYFDGETAVVVCGRDKHIQYFSVKEIIT